MKITVEKNLGGTRRLKRDMTLDYSQSHGAKMNSFSFFPMPNSDVVNCNGASC